MKTNNYFLFISTSDNDNCCIKLMTDNFIELNTLIFSSNKNLINVINPYINEILNRHNLEFHDIKRIYITIGPGSFTGVKVSVSVLKTFAMVFNQVRFFIINDLKYKCFGNGISLIDAKSDKLYIAVYDNNIELIPPKLITKQEEIKYIAQYPNLHVYHYDKKTNFEFDVNIAKLFVEIINPIETLEPLYLKDPI